MLWVKETWDNKPVSTVSVLISEVFTSTAAPGSEDSYGKCLRILFMLQIRSQNGIASRFIQVIFQQACRIQIKNTRHFSQCIILC